MLEYRYFTGSPAPWREEGGGKVRGEVFFLSLSLFLFLTHRQLTHSNVYVERILKDFSCNKLVFFPNKALIVLQILVI